MHDRSLSVAAERIRLLYQQMPLVLAVNAINAALIVFALWDPAAAPRLLAWAGTLALITAARAGLWGWYLRSRPADAEMPGWGLHYTVGSALSGLMWGSTALLFIEPAAPLTLLLIAFVVGGMAAGAVTGLSSHLPAFYAFLFLSVLPLAARLVAENNRVSLSMAALVVVFVLGLVLIGRNFNAALTHRLTLTEEKRRLAEDLERQVRERTEALLAANEQLMRDIAERMQTEQALVEARAAAECADHAKSRFLAAASHDLRQPMQSMFLFAGALRTRIADIQAQEMLTMLERGLDTLKGLLDSLLDVSQLDVNVVRPRIAAIDVRPFLQEIVAAYQPIATSRGLAVRIGEDCNVQALSDPTLLGRMVRNLVENAIRYTERGGVVLDCHLDGDVVLIEVSDTGIGIAPDQLERIFEEFHQIHNPERDKARGLGLGLAIVQRLAGILHHPVEVRSAPGRGSVFSIRVPLDGASPARPAIADAPADAPHEGKLVLLVDDDAIVLLGLRATLESCGYQTVIAGSTEQALERLAGAGLEPDLVIADYRLRGAAVGTEAILAVRAHVGRPVPGIILTGETGAECARDAEEHGFSIIHKPVTPRQLAASLERLTGDQPVR